jgi:anti-sigma regulatory factor (Ser/Thr protein kinase)
VLGFEHEAMLYDGAEGFAAAVLPFIREGLAGGEPMMVALRPERIDLLRAELGGDAEPIVFVDMTELGRNPGRIIPAWREFLDEHGGEGRSMRGIGEPIWAERDDAELEESQLHEALLNLAFADASGFRLLCPYDRRALGAGVIHEACRSHPLVSEDGARRTARPASDAVELLAPFQAPLPPPRNTTESLGYELASLSDVRGAVRRRAVARALAPGQVCDLVTAVNEVATNSVLHGGGNGVLRIWEDDDALICEVRDRGRVKDPLTGRRRPAIDEEGGWGVYLAHQVCDLVQLRSGADGTVVRLRMRLRR